MNEVPLNCGTLPECKGGCPNCPIGAILRRHRPEVALPHPGNNDPLDLTPKEIPVKIKLGSILQKIGSTLLGVVRDPVSGDISSARLSSGALFAAAVERVNQGDVVGGGILALAGVAAMALRQKAQPAPAEG